MKRTLLLFLGLILLAGCGADPTPTPDLVATQIAVEKAAHATMTAEVPTPTPTPIPTDTPVPTNTPLPTETPQPTDTPAPTDTPRPSDAPVPTPGRVEGASPGIPAPAQELADKLTAIGDALSTLIELMTSPRLLDPAWINAVGEQIEIVQLTYEELKTMEVPPELEDLRNSILEATSDCDEAMKYLKSGVEEFSFGDLTEAGELVLSCGREINELRPQMEEYLAPSE